MAQVGKNGSSWEKWQTSPIFNYQCKVDLIVNETSNSLFFAQPIRSLAISQLFPIGTIGGQWGVDIIWPQKRDDSWQGPVFRWGNNKFLDERPQISSRFVSCCFYPSPKSPKNGVLFWENAGFLLHSWFQKSKKLYAVCLQFPQHRLTHSFLRVPNIRDIMGSYVFEKFHC